MTEKKHINSEGIMHAVAVAMFHAGKLEKEQRGDLINAALNAIKVSLIDDLTHGIGVDTVSPEEVCLRLGRSRHRYGRETARRRLSIRQSMRVVEAGL